MNPKTFFLLAGEASGDVHGANLMKSILALHPETKFVGVGGPHMRALGMECFIEAEKLSVIGLVEVLKNISFFKKVLGDLEQAMIERKVDAFIPIDFPDFNIRLAKKVKKQSIPIIYYICPQVWAWRRGRIPLIENTMDVLLTIFPFEAQYFNSQKMKVEFIGHPLCDEVPTGTSPETPPEGEGHLVIMPGSRHSEISHHMPTISSFCKAFHQKYPKVKITIPCAQTLKKEDLLTYFEGQMTGTFAEQFSIADPGQSTEVLNQSHAALIASGTSTLQGALCNIPLALFYRLHPFTFWLGKKLIKLKYVGLANLVADREVCSEYLQDDMSVENLTLESEKLLWDQKARAKVFSDYSEIHEKLGGPGASSRAANIIFDFLK
ncbi:MAG: lipid-A-disaccharide synthase [Planctomycetes bacterium]|nr:lipid-A-disaccharide synthase [Planctomycetota bacterium]